ncbi:MAG: DUF1217 domain-containing protein [Paracoccus sp. (in: a-proteobacteria)]|nr:DUF1217 domain-containing protein [Paracoccus sp. (in: a-proteobacteria)]
MTAPVLIGNGGLSGWQVLARTASRQKQILAASGQVRMASDHFRANIGKVKTAADLVGNYRLLDVALKAHGLEADQNNRFFIRKLLEGGVADDKSLANRLGNKAYAQLARTFGLSLDGTGAVAFDNGFSDRILAQYVEREFEIRVGEGDQNLRMALNANRELDRLAQSGASARTKWFEILGSPPLRKVFEGAFGFDATAYGKLPIDRQVDEFSRGLRRLTGSDDPKSLADPAQRDQLIRRFLVRAEVAQMGASNRFSTALHLLQAARRR